MGAGQLANLVRGITKLFRDPRTEATADTHLLDRFVRQGDGEAFATLVQRHGPMVLGVCRQVLRHEHDAEDVFQATFVILARKAGSIRSQVSVAGWLGRVAYHLALAARTASARRQEVEKKVVPRSPEEPVSEAERREVKAALDEELHRLPDKYHEPFVLCYLEGNTYEEAARRLGWPLGTLKLRLTQARERLRDRLTRRGLSATASAFPAMLSTDALQAAVPGMLVSSTLQAVTGATALPATVAVLVEGGMRQMFLIKLKTIGTAVVVLCLALAGAGTAAHHVLVSGDSGPGNPTESVSLPPAQDQPPGAKVAPKNSPRPADKEPPKNDKPKQPAPKSKSGPPGVPLEITLKSRKDTYTLDRGGKSAAEYLDQIKKTIEGGEVFLPPEVDLTIEVRNTGNKEITFWTAGDPLKLMLELKGPGAYNATLPIDFTYELRLPKGTAFAPGKSHTFKLSSLRFGFRGDSHAAYWTEEGEYTLSATLQTGVSPIPKDAKEYHFDKTYGLVSLTSTPIKLKVVLKGKDKEKGKAPAAPLELSLKLGMEKLRPSR